MDLSLLSISLAFLCSSIHLHILMYKRYVIWRCCTIGSIFLFKESVYLFLYICMYVTLPITKDYVREMIGQMVYVGWPYLTEAYLRLQVK